MKRPLIFLFFLVFIFSVACSILIPLGMWIILKNEPFTLTMLIQHAKFGAYLGAYCGCGIWLLYRFNLHK